MTMSQQHSGQLYSKGVDPGEMAGQVRTRVEEPKPTFVNHCNAGRQMRAYLRADAAIPPTPWLRMTAVLGHTEHQCIRLRCHQSKSLTNRPELIFGRNQVDLGGITRPRSATAATCDIFVGCTMKKAAHFWPAM